MLESIAWILVFASFLLIGVFGYLSRGRGTQKTAVGLPRLFVLIIAAAVSANFLNTIAYQIFTKIEIDTFKRTGLIQEEQMQPDMPNLMAGLFLYGWMFFVAGVVVARVIEARTETCETKQGDDANPIPL